MVRRIISTTKPVKAASEDDKDVIFKDKMDQLNDDFDYIQSGLEKLNRSGMTNEADTIINNLGMQFQSIIADVADQITNRGE
mgnify:FL=1